MSRELLPLSGYVQEPSSVVAGSVVGLIEFLELDLPSGNVYLTNAPMPYTWGGNTYNPTTTTGAPYGSMINYNESTDGTPRPMSLQLSGADPTLVSNLVSNNIQWCKVVWSLGLIDSANNLINGTPMMSQPWYIGDCTITKGNGKASVLINCESLLADMKDRNSGMLQTVQDQQQRFAGDTFFTFAESLMYQWIYWNQQGPMQIGSFGMGGGGGGDNGGGDRIRHEMQ